MKRAGIVSLIIHTGILILIIIGFGDPFERVIKDNRPMVIDFVNVAEISEAPKLSPVNQKKEESVKPKEDVKPSDVVPPPPPEEKKPIEEVKAKPDPKEDAKSEPKIEPKKEEPKIDPDAAPILKKDPKKEDPKKEEPKKDNVKKDPKNDNKKLKDTPKPAKKVDKSKVKEVNKNNKSEDKALVNLHKNKESDKNKKTDPKAKSAVKNPSKLLDKLIDTDDGGEEQGAPADSIGAQLTANEIDAVRQAIRKCWTFNAGLQGAKDIIVDIEMEMDPDGTVKEAQIVDKDRLNKDPAFRTAAESAKRAVVNPECSPLPFPPKKYEQWKKSTFRFNPKDM